jgi:periplasmic copper chaperone A
MRRFVLLSLSAVLLLSGCSAAAPADTIEVADAWVRLPAPMAMDQGMQPTAEGGMAAGSDHSGHMAGTDMNAPGGNSAAYMILKNNGSEDTLISAESDVAATIELHTVNMVDGVMQMREVEGGIPLPAGGETELKPGGFHVMLIGLQHDLAEGDVVELTLKTASGTTLKVAAEVRKP